MVMLSLKCAIKFPLLKKERVRVRLIIRF